HSLSIFCHIFTIAIKVIRVNFYCFASIHLITIKSMARRHRAGQQGGEQGQAQARGQQTGEPLVRAFHVQLSPSKSMVGTLFRFSCASVLFLLRPFLSPGKVLFHYPSFWTKCP